MPSPRSTRHAVITGYNTDIHHHGVTYHVQTEDKGYGTKLIVSLVYCGGSILASKRSSYEDLVPDISDLVELEEQLKRQHKLICAAIGAGRVDELRHLSHKDHLHDHHFHDGDSSNKQDTHQPNSQDALALEDGEDLKSTAHADYTFGANSGLERPVEPEIMFSPDAVKVVPEIASTSVPVSNRLQIQIIDAATLYGGDNKVLGIKISRGISDTGVAGVHLIIKVTATAFSPLIYHSMTNEEGLAHLNIEIPHFNEGRATLVVRAMIAGEKTELRQPIEFG